MNAINFYRVGNYCVNNNIPLIAAVIKYLTFFIFNSVIPPSCKIGKDTRFMYGGIGCVIHPRAIIGDRVCLGQGITIGRKLKDSCPVIGDDIYIGAGARILGDIKIGNNVIIGSNSVVVSDIPDNCIIAGSPAKVIKPIHEPIWSLLGNVL